MANRSGQGKKRKPAGLQPLKTGASGLALVANRRVTMINARWNELATPGKGGWEREDGPARRRHGDLRLLVLDEAARLPMRGGASAVRRFRRVGGDDQVLEVRLERLNGAGAPIAVIAQDITAQVHREQEAMRMREALFQKQHLSILGEMTSAVAHDLGNTLRGLSARATLLAKDPAVIRAKGALLAGLQESVEAAIRSVRSLLEVARSGRLEPQPVDLSAILRQAIATVRLRQSPGSPEIEVDADIPELPPVLGTVPELSHLFVSLLVNACDAMPDGGKVWIEAQQREDRVLVTVADEGAGIAKEDLTHLFQPFFTTKGPAGTGLALWLANSTMRRVGGSISARNRKQRGAEFRVEFPVALDLRVRMGS
ncbi:MAG TPA: HAMP domain-containing sensor histidine kinase [Myxococcales bacterium]|nr:HAMP domain-containing sensor histidine kinase [Myxococcales bacterium]